MDNWDLLIRAKCGELAWLCCLSREKLLELAAMARSHSDDGLLKIHQLACACCPAGQGMMGTCGPDTGGNTGGNTGGGGGVTLTPQCIARFQSAICSEKAQSWLRGLKKAISFITSLPGIDPIHVIPPDPKTGQPEVKLDWNKIIGTIDLLLAACGSGQGSALIQAGVLVEFCTQMKYLRLRTGQLPEFVQNILKPVVIAMAPNDVLALLDECCGG